MMVPETSLLRSKDEALDEDDWHEFTLKDVEVHDSKSGEFVSLFEADVSRPLNLVGKLSIQRNQRKLLLDNSLKVLPSIQVTDIKRYAYGQLSSGQYTLWALGHAGWHVIHPSREYKPIYDSDLDAVFLYYFLKDAYQWSNADCTSRQIFQMLAQDFPKRASDAEAAMELIHKHRHFLKKAFQREDKENASKAESTFQWSTTSIYIHLKKDFPEMFLSPQRVASRRGSRSVRSASLNLRPGARSVESGRLPNGRESDEVSLRSIASSLSSSSRRSARISNDADLLTSQDILTKARALVRFLIWIHTSGTAQADKFGLMDCAKIMFEMFAPFKDAEEASKYISAYAAQLCILLDTPANTPGDIPWKSTPLFQQLQHTSLRPATRKRMLLLQPTLRDQDVRQIDDDDEMDGGGENALEMDDDSSRRSRSGLRPKGSKFADKATQRKTRQMRRSSDGADEDDVVMGDDEEINTPPPQGAGKRKAEATRVDEAPRKRQASEALDSVDGQEEALHDPSSSEGDVLTELPLREKVQKTQPVTKDTSRMRRGTQQHKDARAAVRPSTPLNIPPMVSTPLPSAEPNGPGNSWLCEVDGCSFKVYGADKELGRGLVREHLTEHEHDPALSTINFDCGVDDDDDPRSDVLRLLREEQEACRLPVNHLIKRIREMAEAQKGSSSRDNPGGSVFPSPIQRFY